MPVLPKYQLKELFESGDLITQTTLDELIDATYNELLVAGSNVTLNRVTTPSGTTVTINSTGGGGGGAQGAQGAQGSQGFQGVQGAQGFQGNTGNTGAQGFQGSMGTSLTYDLTSAQDGANVDITLAGSDATTDIIQLSAGANITLTDNGSNEILIDAAGGVTSYTNATPTPQNFPANSPFDNIPTGSTFTNQTFTEMMDQMLYPELFPSLSNPSNGFSLSQAGLQEIGLITALNFSASFNRGSINPQYTAASPYRSGLPNTYVYTGTGVSNNASTSLTDTETVASYTVLSGSQSWTGAVNYDGGVQPKSSKANNYSTPLPAGTASPNTQTITGVYPPFATTVAIATLTKQSLQTMSSLIQVDMQAEVFGGPKQTLDVPNVWSSITGLQQYNTLSLAWDTIALSTFTPTSATTHTIQGNVISYTRYEHNGSTIGGRKLRFTT